ncbi:MAG: sensor domain-containing diguanylate cyclase, partial [Nitrospinae bacterium]|nr:sensor domain-containing diguanylate cyclase [Nitrospinota bacterium]
RWPLRQEGTTNMILSHKGPLFIEDIARCRQFDKSQLLKMGVVSLLAIPLVAEGRTMGILYVDDFKPRQLNSRELRLAGLLGMQAAIALDKLNIIEQTRQEAFSDELTKLYNHRFYAGKLLEEFNRAKRYHNNLSLCIIDVDHFKHYNDTNGHPKGNKVLAGIAAILTRQARNFDIVCRYGGEEFAIILPNTDKESANRFALRVCKRVAEHNFEHGETQPLGRVTISIGVATFPDDGASVEELEEMADKALYNAKESGRNRVCCADSCAVDLEE